MQRWTITDLATAAVLAPCVKTPDAEEHPADWGWPWDADTQVAHPIADEPDLGLQSWTGAAWEEDAAKVEAALIAEVKAAAEQLKLTAITAGFGKAAEYEQKGREANAALDLTLAAVEALDAAEQMERFPAAALESQLGGEPIAAVLERYCEAAQASNTAIWRVAAIEHVGARAVMQATTAEAKRAAHAAIDWSWTA